MTGMPTHTHQAQAIVTHEPWPAIHPRMPAGRYHHPAMDERPDSVTKIGVMADYIAAIYTQYHDARGTQLIYCETVMVYAEIRRQLLLRGIPEVEIAFIQDYHTKTKKAALFAAVNAGRIRVLLASKQSTGMNVQTRLIALHHLDCPWRPGDLEQREGRIVRQGNHFPEVMLFAYVTEGSFDAYRWQLIHTKATFIEQMKRGDVTMREMEDLGDAVLSAAEIKAIASGNPLVMEKVKLDSEVQKLEAAEAGDRDNRVRLRRTIAANTLERQRIQARIPFLQAAQAQAEATADQEFKAAILDGVMGSSATAYTKREAAGEAVLKVVKELDALAQAQRECQTRMIGRYRGFELRGNGYLAGMPDLSLTFEHQGEARAISATTISLKTATGVVQSIDYQLSHIGEEIARAERRLAELDESDRVCTAILATPWEGVAQLATLRERLDAINIELTKTEEVSTPAPSVGEATAQDTAATPPADGFVILAESDADRLTTTVGVVEIAPLVQPAVVLPMPEDRAAMHAAMRILSGAVEAAAPSEQSAPVAAAAEASAPATAAPEVLTVLPRTIALPPRPATQPALHFGHSAAPAKRRTAVKPIAPSIRTVRLEDAQQLGLFGACASEPSGIGDGPVQFSMF